MLGETIAERYRIEEKVGEGGMGVVYRAYDLKVDRVVALKMIREDLASDVALQRRFSLEAHAAGTLNHPRIASLYDFEQGKSGTFLIYEFIDGRTLRAAQVDSPLGLRELLGAYIAIGEGVQAAHESGFVHRDLKPENVMLRQDGQVKILDFGLAKVANSAIGITIATKATAPGVLLGTIAYMSPEQLDGEVADRRSDIFSFGTMLYESATGQHPFEGKSSSSTIGNILKEEPREVFRWLAGAQPELERIARKCMRKRKEDRYQSAGEIVVDLRHFLQNLDGRPGPDASPSSDFTIDLTYAKAAFQLTQAAYLAVYAAALHWGLKDDGGILRRLFHLQDAQVQVAMVLIGVAAMCGVATRLYLMSAVGWSHPDGGRKFLWLFPWLLLFDGVLWSSAPILLWEKLEWLSLFLVAAMAYLPFAQRTLIRTLYPGVTVRKSGTVRPSSRHS